jgi:two-component system chemotaxis response regulator CheB
MIRVMVVDDSPLARKIASDILQQEKDIAVVSTAASAEFALQKLDRTRPDVITMDLEMPGMGGLAGIREIMSRRPVPVLVLSAHAQEGARMTLQALDSGAVDFVLKPTGSLSGGIDEVARELVEKVRQASRITPSVSVPAEGATAGSRRIGGGAGAGKNGSSGPRGAGRYELVSIGTSTGGPVALRSLLTALPGDFPTGIVVVQHMPPVFTQAFAERLNTLCALGVKEAENGEPILAGRVYIAPGDRHMTVSRLDGDSKVLLNKATPVCGHRPSVDVLMHSVARAYGERAVGVIMTGMGKDGAGGLHELKRRGGYVLAQDEESSVIFGMNREVIVNGDADEVVALQDIPECLARLAASRQSAAAGADMPPGR